jgi:hypothetical protein
LQSLLGLSIPGRCPGSLWAPTPTPDRPGPGPGTRKGGAFDLQLLRSLQIPFASIHCAQQSPRRPKSLRADGASGRVVKFRDSHDEQGQSFLSNGASKILPLQAEGSVLSKDDLLPLDDLIGHIMVEYGHINGKDKVTYDFGGRVRSQHIIVEDHLVPLEELAVRNSRGRGADGGNGKNTRPEGAQPRFRAPRRTRSQNHTKLASR